MPRRKKMTPGTLKRRVALFLNFQYRRLTAKDRVTPDFVVIGSQKCGTTSLYQYIKTHPNFVAPYKKGGTFFDANFSKGFSWYRAHFPLVSQMSEKRSGGGAYITGEVATSYIHHPLAAKRMAELLPSTVKLLAVIRNPVERAYSHYQHMVRTGRETLSFRDALDAEAERVDLAIPRVVAGDDEALRFYRDYSYKSRGRYAEQLERWFDAFDRNQFLILKSEDLFGKPAWACNQIYSFLNLPAWEQSHYDNANPGRYSPADVGTLGDLAEYFKPFNQRLYEMLGADLGWDAVKY
ncbi:MAG: sulfotransferase domain-containing protein [Chloroflexota bacterium]